MKIVEKKEAIKLRRQGLSLPFIARELNVSKGTVSLWVRDISLSERAKRKIESLRSAGQIASQKALKERTGRALSSAKAEAEALVNALHYDREMALVLCSLLYWCEGTKRHNDNEFTFSNSDPALVQAFMVFMRRSLTLSEIKFRVKMHLHEYHNEAVEKRFWSKITRIPENQFQSTFWKSNTGNNIHPGYRGCAHIRYHDVRVSRAIYATARAFLENVIK